MQQIIFSYFEIVFISCSPKFFAQFTVISVIAKVYFAKFQQKFAISENLFLKGTLMQN